MNLKIFTKPMFYETMTFIKCTFLIISFKIKIEEVYFDRVKSESIT